MRVSLSLCTNAEWQKEMPRNEVLLSHTSTETHTAYHTAHSTQHTPHTYIHMYVHIFTDSETQWLSVCEPYNYIIWYAHKTKSIVKAFLILISSCSSHLAAGLEMAMEMGMEMAMQKGKLCHAGWRFPFLLIECAVEWWSGGEGEGKDDKAPAGWRIWALAK